MKFHRLAWLAGLVLAVSCGGAGPSCGGCAPANYTYPSLQTQGTETVDDGVRARMTERGLDFLATHFKDILRQQFPPMPGNPNVSRFQLPSQTFVDEGTSFGDVSICLQGTSNPPPAGCANPTVANKVSSVLLDLSDLENKLTVDFINTPQSGIRVTAQNLLLGFDGRIRSNVRPFDLFTSDADCDLTGATVLPGGPFPSGTIGAIDITAHIYPQVSTDPMVCQNGAAQCFTASIVVTDAAIRGVGLEVNTPQRCTGTNTPAGCSNACSDQFGIGCNPSDNGCFFSAQNILCPDAKGDCECRDFFCPGYDVGAEVLGQMADFLFTVLEPVLDNLLTTALEQALDSFNGQPLEFTGQMDIATFAGGQVPSLANANTLGFQIAPTNAAFQVTCPPGTNSCEQRRGMDMYLKTGIEAVHDPVNKSPAPNECVAAIDGAKFLEMYAAAAFETPDGAPLSGEFLDGSGMPRVYDVGASLALAALNQAGFAAYNAGVLCLALDSQTVHQLGGGVFQLTAGALDLLTGGRLTQYVDPKAPVIITLAPEEPPIFAFGAGTENDPHMHVDVRKMHVNIYVLMYERYARLFEVVTDLAVGLNVTPNPATHELTIALAQGPELSNFQQVYNELLPDVDWGTLLPSLINVALGALLNQDISFNYDVAPLLSDALGVPIYIVFEGLHTQYANGRGEFLNLYLSFSDTNPNPLSFVATPQLQPHQDVQTWYLDGRDIPRATGFARLTGVLAGLPQDMHYSYRVDFGPWHDWVPVDNDGILYVQDSKLALVGQHAVDVRAMQAGQPATQSQDFRRVMVWTDPAAPQLWLNRLEGRVAVRAEDRVAPLPSLQMRWRVDNGGFGEWLPVGDIDGDALEDARVLEVEVRDPAGNVARQFLALRVDSAVLATAQLDGEDARDGSRCACARPVDAGMPMLGLLLMALGLVRRRR